MSEEIIPYGYRGLQQALDSQAQQRPRRKPDQFHGYWFCRECAEKIDVKIDQRGLFGFMPSSTSRSCCYCEQETRCYLVHQTEEAHAVAMLGKPKQLPLGDGYEIHQLKLYDPTTPHLNLIQYYLMNTEIPSGQVADTLVNQIARVCHETNGSYCNSICDHSQTSWDDAPDWQKQSAINGVKFHLGHPDATPENSHESWLAEKKAAGWKYGPVKNVDKLEHPCFVPYDQLPFEQKIKDFLFRGVIHAFLDAGADLGQK